MAKKTYVLDTGILLGDPDSLFGFDDNHVCICGTTLQQMDDLKADQGEAGRSAREACRLLDSLGTEGDLLSGVPLPNGGTLFVEPGRQGSWLLPEGFPPSKPGNRIISACLHLARKGGVPVPVVLLSNDAVLRVNAAACGVEAQGVLNDQVEDTGYPGHIEIEVPQRVVDALHAAAKADGIDADEVPGGSFAPNQFVTLSCGGRTALAVHSGGRLYKVGNARLFGGARTMNRTQAFAAHALTDPDVPLVVLEGPAGTAKTFLSIAAALGQCRLMKGDSGPYRKILISKPNVETSEKGMGYLPGGLEEKMGPLLASYRDALESLFRGKNGDEAAVAMQVDDLFESGVIEVCPLNYIRGRSLEECFLILDEAQNAGRSLVRDVVTRAGRGTKVVACGDVTQVDSPSLDAKNNGLAYLLKSMSGSRLAAVVRTTGRDCVRSDLAEEALRRMKG